MKAKTSIRGLFLFALLFLLSACSVYDSGVNEQAADQPAEAVAEKPKQPKVSKPEKQLPIKWEEPEPFSGYPRDRELYRAVLQEDAAFYSTAAGEDITISQLSKAVSPEVDQTIPIEFAVIDLDGDGPLEVILRLKVNEDEYFGYEILRCHEETVYGYTVWYRAFMDLASDGTFYGSGGAGWQSWHTMQFDADSYTANTYAHTEIEYDSYGSRVLFFVGEEEVSEGVYYDRVREWRKGGEVRWYPFTNENLIQVFGEPALTPENFTESESKANLAIEAYRAILQEEASFAAAASGEFFDIAHIKEMLVPDTDFPAVPDSFALADLDHDGTPELLLSVPLGSTGSSLVLRYEDGVVYSFSFSARALDGLRKDGTFWASGGASNCGICAFAFSGDQYTVDKITYCITSPPISNFVKYFVDHKGASEAEYNLAADEWQKTPCLDWYAYTGENIDRLLTFTGGTK